MIFNETNLKQIEDKFFNDFNYFETGNLTIARNMVSFFKDEKNNIPLFAKQIIDYFEKSSLKYLIKKEDFNKLDICFESEPRNKFILVTKEKEIICDIYFEGSFVEKIKNPSEYKFSVVMSKLVNQTSRNSFEINSYKNNFFIKGFSKIDKTLKIIKDFHKQLDLGCPTICLEDNIKSINDIEDAIRCGEFEFFSFIEDGSKGGMDSPIIFPIGENHPIDFVYDSFSVFEKTEIKLEEFRNFIYSKRKIDKKLKSLKFKTKGLQITELSNCGFLSDLDCNKYYIAISQALNNNPVELMISSNSLDIEDLYNGFIYIKSNDYSLTKSNYILKDYIDNKDETVGYLSLAIY